MSNCKDCGKEYEAFIFPNGEESGGGRCPTCRDAHLKKLATELVQEPAPVAGGRKPGEGWKVVQVCKCGQPYEAQHYVALSGKPADLSRGLCYQCREKLEAERIAREEAEKARVIKKQRDDYRALCGIPPLYRDERFETWQAGRPGNVDKIMELCKKYAEDYPILTPQNYRSLVLTSPKIWGLGKTHLVASIAHRILDRWNGIPARNPVFMVVERDLLRRIRRTYNHASQESEDSILKQLVSVPLLILDDIGKYKTNDLTFVSGILFDIINGRYNNNKLPLILTANMSNKEFKVHLGGENEASLDRLLEMCGGEFYEVEGKSYRRG